MSDGNTAQAYARNLWVEALIGVPDVDAQTWSQLPLLLRWLVACRASVLPLTLFAVTFALCLAWPTQLEQWLLALVCLLALLLAHATNNLINDYVDHLTGLDQDNYFRTRYGTHPLAQGLMNAPQLRRYIAVTGVSALLLACGLSFWVGGRVYVFAAAGGLLVLFYTYPLKHFALGELAVFLAWGPLMIAGVYFVMWGEVDAGVLWAASIYGLAPTVVIFAKHTDKSSDDQQRGVHTLPNLIGAPARYVVFALACLQVLATVVYAWFYHVYGMLLLVLALPALWQLYRICCQVPPPHAPSGYPAQAWPLWYTTHAFVYARSAGLWLTVGLLVQGVLQR